MEGFKEEPEEPTGEAEASASQENKSSYKSLESRMREESEKNFQERHEVEMARLAAGHFLAKGEREIKQNETTKKYLGNGAMIGQLAALGGLGGAFAFNSPEAFWAGTASAVAGPLVGYMGGKFKEYLDRRRFKQEAKEKFPKAKL